MNAQSEPYLSFPVADATVARYRQLFNGTGLWDRFVYWIAKSQYSHDEARDILAEIVEGALIATFSSIRPDGQTEFCLPKDREEILVSAMLRRVSGRLAHKDKEYIVEKLLQHLKTELASGKILLVDGGRIFWKNDLLWVRVNTQKFL